MYSEFGSGVESIVGVSIGSRDLGPRVQCPEGEVPSDSVWRCPRAVPRPDGAIPDRGELP